MEKIKFLVDENVPGFVRKSLIKAGYDASSPNKGTSDVDVAKIAKRQGRVILTLDKDFTNTVLFPPSQFDIIQCAIHPPDKHAVLKAVNDLLSAASSPATLKGLIIVTKHGFTKIEK